MIIPSLRQLASLYTWLMIILHIMLTFFACNLFNKRTINYKCSKLFKNLLEIYNKIVFACSQSMHMSTFVFAKLVQEYMIFFL